MSRLRRLLLPLDGSRPAEAALGLGAFLARRLGAELVLLHVLERRPPERVHGQPHLRSAPEAQAYLDRVAARLREQDLKVETHLHAEPEADVAAAIAAHIREQAGDLVVMSTHGQGGVRGWALGSIAQQVVRRGCPVLLVRPEAPAGPPEAVERVVVPLDGTPTGEAALPMAAAVAAGCVLPVTPITVVPSGRTPQPERRPVAAFLPGTTAAFLDLEAEAADQYLKEVSRRLEAEFGLRAATEVRRGHPAAELARVTGRETLLVMATRGRYGLGGLWAGSVSARVVAATRGPVLLVPAP